MLYQLLHRIFGWDYVYWRNSSCDFGIARVHIDGDGRPFYWQYKSIKCAKRIVYKDDFIWLTCPSSKYIKKEKETES